jgi:molybdopterin biosynthesis enzyme
MLANDIHANHPIPGTDRSMLYGFAVQASTTLWASAYNPIEVPLRTVTRAIPCRQETLDFG